MPGTGALQVRPFQITTASGRGSSSVASESTDKLHAIKRDDTWPAGTSAWPGQDNATDDEPLKCLSAGSAMRSHRGSERNLRLTLQPLNDRAIVLAAVHWYSLLLQTHLARSSFDRDREMCSKKYTKPHIKTMDFLGVNVD